MSAAKIDSNKEIVRLRDKEGRLFWWIAEEIYRQFDRKLAEKNVIKIYRREKAKEALSK